MAASHPSAEPLSFQRMILTLHDYWSAHGCLILQPYDMEMGAGTFHPATTLRAHFRTRLATSPGRYRDDFRPSGRARPAPT